MSEQAYEHNGRPVDAQVFYAIACDPRRSVVVEACAGAGKTWMLVSRILRALLAGAQPHEILAITFTKKAAGEMRQRLHQWLADFAVASPEKLAGELAARGLAHPRDEDVKALQGLYARMLAQGRPIRILTFHAWFASLLRNAPLAVMNQLRLPANYQLLEDDAEAIDLVWRHFHSAVLRDPQARADFEASVAAHGRFQTRKALGAALAKRVEFAFADDHGAVAQSVKPMGEQFPQFAGIDDPCALLQRKEVKSALAAAARALGRASAKTYAAKGVELEQAIAAADLDAAFGALLTKDGAQRKFGEKLEGIEHIRAAQDLALELVQACRQHDAWQHQQRMARLARVLIAEFAAMKRSRGWIDMNDVEQAAQVLLADPVLSGFVQEKLDARVRHLLIDEFQDTNPLQWQALHAWLQSYAGAGDAPAIFIVGDPKQSIYRFRRAEPQVFLAAQAFIRELGGDALGCDLTRRNSHAVMSLVNTVMSQAQEAGEYARFRTHVTLSDQAGDVASLPQILRDAIARNETGVAGEWRDTLTVPRDLPEERLVTLECRQAAAWIAHEISQGTQPKDILVLARKRDRLAVMEQELRLLRIPAQQPQKNDLREEPEVQDIVALVDALVSTTHDLSLARALRSPLFAVSEDDLVAIALAVAKAREEKPRTSWYEVLQAQAVESPRLQQAAVQLAAWKAMVDRLPPHDALEEIYRTGDVVARFAAVAPAALREGVVSHLRALLGAALDLDGGRYATPYAFVRALRSRRIEAPPLADTQAVRLLTVHGAKGLEAPVVLLLDTDSGPPAAETMGVVVEWPGDAPAPWRFSFIASETKPPPCNEEALAVEFTERAREELNTLYVAMTRAKERLVVSSVAPARAGALSWWQRLQPHCKPLATPAAATPFADSAAAATIELQVLPALTVPAVPRVRNDDPDSPASRFGQALHKLLEFCGGTARVPPAAIERVAREFALGDSQARIAARRAESILAGEGAWAWDPRVVEWQGNEVPMSFEGRSIRLDRLVKRRDTGEWWVLDYKSEYAPEKNAELLAQMRDYRAAVSRAYPQDGVKAAFLTGEGRLVMAG